MKRLLSAPSVPLAAGLFGLIAMLFLGFVWYSASPILGRVYAGVRVAETLGAWPLTYWGSYFVNVPNGQPYAFISIYKSSVLFGVIFAFVTAIIGLFAFRKVREQHLNVLMAEPPGGFTGAYATNALQSVSPHLVNASVRIPTTPLRLPTQNPFAALLDLRDRTQVSRAVAELSWPEAATLALAIDAYVPIKNRKPNSQMLDVVWRAVRTSNNNDQAPSNVEQATIAMHLVEILTQIGDRNVADLNKVHDAMKKAITTHDALANVALLAREAGCFPLMQTAWLRFADPLLHDRIASVDLPDNA